MSLVGIPAPISTLGSKNEGKGVMGLERTPEIGVKGASGARPVLGLQFSELESQPAFSRDLWYSKGLSCLEQLVDLKQIPPNWVTPLFLDKL